MSQIDKAKQEVFDYVRLMLGDGMIDVELDPEHYETALKRSLGVFRQRSDNSVREHSEGNLDKVAVSSGGLSRCDGR